MFSTSDPKPCAMTYPRKAYNSLAEVVDDSRLEAGEKPPLVVDRREILGNEMFAAGMPYLCRTIGPCDRVTLLSS